ncbi:syncoilin-like [Xyrauchen texanus]|uniref:syncoilin-like n=1 Tax=Xyrauchen texanus TaxID=154827 RepID=UPI0022424CC8|nr:syncoilin-like [Xyrauchen texanus]
MEDQEVDFEETYGSLSETEGNYEPLFIDEEDEDYFEDCLEEAALALPIESLPYSQRCREALQAEFNGLMQQMLAQLDIFDTTHSNTSTPLPLISETEKKNTNGITKTITFGETCIPEKEKTVYLFKDEALSFPFEAWPDLCTTMEIKNLRAAFESCIDEVGQLERRRDELVQELLELEEPMAQELQTVREALGKEQGLLSKVRLQKQSLQEETKMTKRRLFIAVRDCTQKQVELEIQQKEVEQLNQAQEDLNAFVVKLTEEITKLHADHQNDLLALKKQQSNITQESSKKKTHSYVTQGRRASCDLQQYLQGGIKALEEFYEPRLLSLLKRRDATVDALSMAKEQCQELKAQLGPLREKEQQLRLHRTFLEERIRLMEEQRMENVEQYQETVDLLEKNSCEIKTELQIQMKKTKELEMVKNSMSKELLLYRESVKGLCKQEKTLVVEQI